MPAPRRLGRAAPAASPAPSAPAPASLRTRLILEGRKLLEENGATELSLREVARRAGVSEAAPSRHFAGKEGLLAAIAATGFEQLADERVHIAARDMSPMHRAHEMMLSYVRFARANPGLFNLMTGPRLLESFSRQEIEAPSNQSFSFFADSIHDLALASGWPQEQLAHLAHAAWSVEHGVATLLLAGVAPRTDGQMKPDTMVEFSIKLLLSAVAAGPQAMQQTGHALLG